MQLIQNVTKRLAIQVRALLISIPLVMGCTAWAQVAGTGTIQGSVADQTGAVIPGATVTLTESATHVQRVAKSDSGGVYVFPNIEVGNYSVMVSAGGFQTYTKTGNVLEVGSNIAVNVQMTVGTQDQKIEVKAEGLALQTEDVSFKQTIDQAEVTELPLNSNARQITGLLAISGGSTPAPAGDFTGSKFSYQTISVSIAGGGGNTTLWRLDGGDNNDYMGNGNLPFPFPDAVSQFSVESTALGAQDGMHSGGLVNVVTRSGTNAYHGSAFEFIRNNYLDATNFFAVTKDQLHQNQFGGTFGGRILRDKLFAFAGYQRLESKQTSASTQATIPTAANLAGDYSVTDPLSVTAGGTGPNACNTKTTQLLDPLTGVALPGNKYTTAPAYNAQSLALLKYLPAINPAYDSSNCGFVAYAIPQDVYDNEFVTRVDWNLNARNNVYARYFIDGYQAPAFYSPTNILITTASGNVERVQTFTLGENFTLNSRFVNSAHISILRRVNNRGYAPSDINAATLGVNLYQAVPNGLQISEGKFTIGGGTNSVSHFNDNTLAIDDDVTLVVGRHQLVFGGEFVRNQLNISNAYESNGVFTFNGEYSGSGPTGTNPTTKTSVIGDQSLDFLMGTLNTFQQSKMQQNALRGNVPSLYFQDTFHATKQMTLVAGIRWSPEFVPTDTKNRGTIFNYQAFLNNQVSTVYPNAPAGTFFYGDAGVPKAFTKNSPWQFSPNIGAAYDVGGRGKTVLRAGAELIYDEVNFFTSQRTQQNPPFASAISQTQTATTPPISFTSPWSVGSITTNPFPQPIIPSPSTAQFFSQSQYIVLPVQFHPSYTTQWTASVQHQFRGGWQLQVDYVGNKTTHAPISTPLSPAVFIPGVQNAAGTGCPGLVLTGPAGKAAAAAGTSCSTVANQNQRFALTIANPAQGNQYGGGGTGSALVGYGGMANYNGLITTVQRRLSGTFSLLANYTWSHCLNIADSAGDLASGSIENSNNPGQDYGPCGSDYRHVVNIVPILKSNFHFNRIANLIVNGWEIAPLAHILSGAPVNVISGSDISLTAEALDRPNRVPGVPLYTHIPNRSGTGSANRAYLNPAAFCVTSTVASPCPDPVTPGTFGNVGRNAFRGLPNYQFDAQVSRIFPIHDSLNATFRLEGFNVLNHPSFSTPTATVSSSTFGQLAGTANNARVFQGSIKLAF